MLARSKAVSGMRDEGIAIASSAKPTELSELL